MVVLGAEHKVDHQHRHGRAGDDHEHVAEKEEAEHVVDLIEPEGVDDEVELGGDGAEGWHADEERARDGGEVTGEFAAEALAAAAGAGIVVLKGDLARDLVRADGRVDGCLAEGDPGAGEG